MVANTRKCTSNWLPPCRALLVTLHSVPALHSRQLGSGQKCRFLGFTPELLNQNLRRRGPGPPGVLMTKHRTGSVPDSPTGESRTPWSNVSSCFPVLPSTWHLCPPSASCGELSALPSASGLGTSSRTRRRQEEEVVWGSYFMEQWGVLLQSPPYFLLVPHAPTLETQRH